MNIKKVLTTVCVMACTMAAMAQDKIQYPDISYAGTPRSVTIGGIAVSGADGYEDYMLTGISGLSVGQQIDLPGDEITDAIKHYWKYGLSQRCPLPLTRSYRTRPTCTYTYR